MDTNVTKTDVTEIDRALAKAKGKRAAKATASAPVTDNPTEKLAADKAAIAAAKEKARLERVAARAAKKAAREAELVVKRAARAAIRAEKAANKGPRGPAHMSKVEKAAAKLPAMSTAAQESFDLATSSLSRDQLLALSLHLQHHVRAASTVGATKIKLENGQLVTIVSGAPKYVGMQATVLKAQRIRCYCTISGVDKPIYLFTSDVEPVLEEATATGTEG